MDSKAVEKEAREYAKTINVDIVNSKKGWIEQGLLKVFKERGAIQIIRSGFEKGFIDGAAFGRSQVIEEIKTLVKGLSGRRISHDKLLLLIDELSKVTDGNMEGK